LIQSFYNQKIKNGSSRSTAQYTHRVLHKALSQAVIAGIITRNPTEGALISKPKHKEMKFYDETQSSQLLLAVKGTRNEALYQIELSTGMRQSELIALKWSDLDWKNQTITIQRQLVRNSKSKEDYFSDLKTDAAYRTISLGDYSIQKLREHMEFQNTERMDPSRDMWIENDMIFPSIVGTPMNQSNLYKSFKNTIKEAGLPEIRFHDLRHTAASLMLNHGVPVIVVSKRLGHSKVSITMDIYGHLIPESQKDIGQIMDGLITPIEFRLDSVTVLAEKKYQFAERKIDN
jgi:integrase